VPLHAIIPDGQAHEPLAHIWPPAQVFPHEPQFAESVIVSTQLPLHAIWPDGHERRHMPALHVRPLGHALPHAPQFVLLVARSTHVPLQFD
jgi:hypothetical protein